MITHTYYQGCVLDDGSYIDYGFHQFFNSPSHGWWMIPGTWKHDD